MRYLFIPCAVAALLAAAPYLVQTASARALSPQRTETTHPATTNEAVADSAARCADVGSRAGKPCDKDADAAQGAEREAARDTPPVYADARSTRLRNRAYLRAAAWYCERYSGRVRSACVDEAEAIYGP